MTAPSGLAVVGARASETALVGPEGATAVRVNAAGTVLRSLRVGGPWIGIRVEPGADLQLDDVTGGGGWRPGVPTAATSAGPRAVGSEPLASHGPAPRRCAPRAAALVAALVASAGHGCAEPPPDPYAQLYREARTKLAAAIARTGDPSCPEEPVCSVALAELELVPPGVPDHAEARALAARVRDARARRPAQIRIPELPARATKRARAGAEHAIGDGEGGGPGRARAASRTRPRPDPRPDPRPAHRTPSRPAGTGEEAARAGAQSGAEPDEEPCTFCVAVVPGPADDAPEPEAEPLPPVSVATRAPPPPPAAAPPPAPVPCAELRAAVERRRAEVEANPFARQVVDPFSPMNLPRPAREADSRTPAGAERDVSELTTSGTGPAAIDHDPRVLELLAALRACEAGQAR